MICGRHNMQPRRSPAPAPHSPPLSLKSDCIIFASVWIFLWFSLKNVAVQIYLHLLFSSLQWIWPNALSGLHRQFGSKYQFRSFRWSNWPFCPQCRGYCRHFRNMWSTANESLEVPQTAKAESSDLLLPQHACPRRKMKRTWKCCLRWGRPLASSFGPSPRTLVSCDVERAGQVDWHSNYISILTFSDQIKCFVQNTTALSSIFTIRGQLEFCRKSPLQELPRY